MKFNGYYVANFETSGYLGVADNYVYIRFLKTGVPLIADASHPKYSSDITYVNEIKQKRLVFIRNVLSEKVHSSFTPASYQVKGQKILIKAGGFISKDRQIVPDPAGTQIEFEGTLGNDFINGLLTHTLWGLESHPVRFVFNLYAY